MASNTGALLEEWMKSHHAEELHLKYDGTTWRMVAIGEYYHLEVARDAADHNKVDGVHATLHTLLERAVAENDKTDKDESYR